MALTLQTRMFNNVTDMVKYINATLSATTQIISVTHDTTSGKWVLIHS